MAAEEHVTFRLGQSVEFNGVGVAKTVDVQKKIGKPNLQDTFMM